MRTRSRRDGYVREVERAALKTEPGGAGADGLAVAAASQIAVADRLVEAEILDEKRLRKFVGK